MPPSAESLQDTLHMRGRAGDGEIGRDAHMHVQKWSASLFPGCLHPKQ